MTSFTVLAAVIAATAMSPKTATDAVVESANRRAAGALEALSNVSNMTGTHIATPCVTKVQAP
ncbi:hypothetical protein COEX109129_42225 [Corallococcus exiguus]